MTINVFLSQNVVTRSGCVVLETCAVHIMSNHHHILFDFKTNGAAKEKYRQPKQRIGNLIKPFSQTKLQKAESGNQPWRH